MVLSKQPPTDLRTSFLNMPHFFTSFLGAFNSFLTNWCPVKTNFYFSSSVHTSDMQLFFSVVAEKVVQRFTQTEKKSPKLVETLLLLQQLCLLQQHSELSAKISKYQRYVFFYIYTCVHYQRADEMSKKLWVKAIAFQAFFLYIYTHNEREAFTK